MPTSLIVQIALAAQTLAPDATRMTTVVDARLRAAPSVHAAVLAELPIGTGLTVVAGEAATGKWSQVTTGNRRGWIAASVTTAFTPADRVGAVETILRRRLPPVRVFRTTDGESFRSRAQIVALIERTLPEVPDRETLARFTWYRLRAIDHALAAIPLEHSGASPYGAWLEARRSMATVFEIRASWVLDRAFVQQTRDAFADTSAADDLDWLAAVSVRSTECEGDVVCIVENQNTLGGDYLGRWPSGRHVDEALRETARQLNGQMDNLEKFPRVLAAFRPESDCGALHASLDPLRTVVAASTSGSKALALTAIDRFARLCLAPSH